MSFRTRYLGFDELTDVVHKWAADHPDLVRVTSLGNSLEGRPLWLLIIGPEPDRVRPTAWVDGNMHASEVAGSSVALAIAEAVLDLHLGKPSSFIPEHLAAWIREGVLFHILPRMSPDGAERVLTTGAYVRSNPRDRRNNPAPHWRAGDVNGDGRARLMRRRDPAGDFVESSEIPGLMLPRRIEDPGPYFALHPEGVIDNWDGFSVPVDHFLGDNDTDMNRNFPYDWAPEPKQIGAGSFPGSEPESQAVIEWVSARPEIFSWLNLHCFGGCYIRPLGDQPDEKMEASDLALYRQIGEWTERYAHYPMVSGFKEFTYEPEKPLLGELCGFAHEHRGAVAMVCELWDFFHQVGLPTLRPFVHNYDRRSVADAVAMGRWDKDHNGGRAVGDWKAFDHPQLGAVEIGGFDPRFGVWNPPEDRLSEVCDHQIEVFFRIAALAPRVRVEAAATHLSGDLYRVDAIVENHGYLPTFILGSSKELPWNRPLRAEISGNLKTVSGSASVEVGHLAGWGAYEQSETMPYARTVSSPVRAKVSWVIEVKGAGDLTVLVSGPRVGRVEAHLKVG